LHWPANDEIAGITQSLDRFFDPAFEFKDVVASSTPARIAGTSGEVSGKRL